MLNAWTSIGLLLCAVILCSGVGAFECNNLKRFRCKKGKTAKVNGCTWKKDKFKQYRHFPSKKKLFGICLNAGQSESEVFGTPAEQCDCGTKCMRKCKSKSGYKKKCYWASRDGSPKSRAGTCLPNRHFADSGPVSICEGPGYQLSDKTNLEAATTAWKANETDATITYGDISCWDTSLLTDLQGMFEADAVFNGDISTWDTSKVTTMEKTFMNAEAFNGDLSKWDTSEVTTMAWMFSGASIFNRTGSLSKWDTSKVATMLEMFKSAEAFNGDLSKWDTSAVESMS